MSVEPGFATWLKSQSRMAEGRDLATIGAWGGLAASSEIVSPLALKADADVEATRQLAFLGPAKVEETISVPGLHASLYGHAIRLFADATGYRDGPIVFVIGVAEQGAVRRTKLTVLRRLA